MQGAQESWGRRCGSDGGVPGVRVEKEAVLRVRVTAQVHLPLEGSTAEAAGEGLEAAVFSSVGDQVGGLAECLAADHALVGLLTCGIHAGEPTSSPSDP